METRLSLKLASRILRSMLQGFLLVYCSLCAAATKEKIPDVVISAPAFNELANYTFRSPTTVSKEDMQASGVHNISDVLQQSSDIQLQHLYEGSPITPSMRGFGDNASSNVLILINGMPISYSDMGAVLLDTMPLNNIARIDILPGSAGVLYGDQAVGGVINIVTQSIVGSHYQSKLASGSYGAFKFNAGFTHPVAKEYDIHLGGQYYRTDNYRQHNELTQGNTNFGFNKQYTQGSVQLNYQYHINNLQYPGALTLEQIAENRRQAQNNTDFDNQQHHDLTLRWKQVINDNNAFNQGVLIQMMFGKGVLTTPFDEERNLIETNPTFLGSFEIKKKPVHYQTGVSLEYSRYLLEGTQFFNDSKQYKGALFSQFVIALKRHLNLSVGARGATSQSTLTEPTSQRAINSALISELGLEWELNNHIKFYLRRAGSYRFPKAEENALSKDDILLKTQKGVSYETGLIWQYSSSQLNIDLYQLNLTNEIMYVPTISGLLGENENLAPTKRFGGSMRYQFPITKKIKAGVSYSYVNARFRSGPNRGKRIPFVAANKGTIHINYAFARKWNLRIETILLGDRVPDGDVTNQGNLLQGYAIVNIALCYKYKHFSITAVVHNLTNLKYNYFAQIAPSGLGIQTFYYPAPTRNFWLSAAFDM